MNFGGNSSFTSSAVCQVKAQILNSRCRTETGVWWGTRDAWVSQCRQRIGCLKKPRTSYLKRTKWNKGLRLIFWSTSDWKHAQTLRGFYHFYPAAAFHSPFPTHLHVRKCFFTHCLFWKPGFKDFKAFLT